MIKSNHHVGSPCHHHSKSRSDFTLRSMLVTCDGRHSLKPKLWHCAILCRHQPQCHAGSDASLRCQHSHHCPLFCLLLPRVHCLLYLVFAASGRTSGSWCSSGKAACYCSHVEASSRRLQCFHKNLRSPGTCIFAILRQAFSCRPWQNIVSTTRCYRVV